MKGEIDFIERLIRAHAEGDVVRFRELAKLFILDLAASNRHGEARILQEALDKAAGNFGDYSLKALPKNKRDGDSLVVGITKAVSRSEIFLSRETWESLNRVILEQRRKKQLERHGLSPKSKLIFWGPPGCGKTLCAHLLANELRMPLLLVRLSALVTSYVGETASNLQRVFNTAASMPSVLLLDEFDALGKNRDDKNDVGELKRVVNSLLQAIDLFPCKQSIMIAASNHQYLLDEAVWRRFDDVLEFPPPDPKTRERYLKHLLAGVTVNGSYKQLAQRLNGLSYSDIETIAVDAIKTMLLEEKTAISYKDIMSAAQSFKTKRKRAKVRSG